MHMVRLSALEGNLMCNRFAIYLVFLGLVACGDDSSTADAESDNWYDTNGTSASETTGDQMTADENADGKAGQAKPEGQKSLGLTWTGEIDLETGSGTIELAYTNANLSACTASAAATVEDYSETTCEQCTFQAGLRFDDFAIADESAAGCSNLVEMRGARIDVAHGTRLLINYAGVNYNQLLELSEDGMFTVSEKGYSALPNETTWLVGIK